MVLTPTSFDQFSAILIINTNIGEKSANVKNDAEH